MTVKEKASLEGISTDIKWIRSALEKDCGRIDDLEKEMSKAKGWAVGAGSIVAIAWSIIAYVIGRK